MKKYQYLILILVFLLLISINICVQGSPLQVLIATSGAASSGNFRSQTVWNIINKYIPEIIVGSLVETGGSYDEANRVGILKEVQIGEQTAMGALQELYSGTGKFTEPHPELRMLYGTVLAVYPFIVRVEENINKIEDLEGKKYNEGPPGSGEESITKTTLNVLGIKPNYRSSSVADAVSMMKNRQIVGLTKSTLPDALDSSMVDIATTQKLAWLGFTKEQTEKISKTVPLFYWYEVKKNSVQGLPDANGWFLASLLSAFTTKELPQKVVYNMVKTIFEHMDEIIAADSKWGLGIGKTPAEQMNSFAGIEGLPPMHAGVIQYWEELGLNVPEKLIPPDYVKN
jgi:TRAP transporter TAXI family solute receptor